MDPPAPANDLVHSQALSILGNASQPLDKGQLDAHGQHIRVSVSNDGDVDIANVFVQYWVCAFNAGFSSKLFLPSALGSVGRQVPTTAPSADIVEAHKNHPFLDPVEWYPTTKELDDAGLRDPNNLGAEIHACLYANVFVGGGEGTQIADLAAEMAKLPSGFDLNDRHHAQRNIALFYPDPNNPPPLTMKLWMHVGNPDIEAAQEVQIVINEVTLPPRRVPDPIVLDHLLRNPRILSAEEDFGCEGDESLLERTIPGLAIRVGDELQPIRTARTPLDDLRIEAGDLCEREPTITLGADDFQGIRLVANLPEDEDGENVLRVFDVAQMRDGRAVGEARVLFLNAPAEVEPQSSYAD